MDIFLSERIEASFLGSFPSLSLIKISVPPCFNDKKISRIDKSKCIGCVACTAVVAETFRLEACARLDLRIQKPGVILERIRNGRRASITIAPALIEHGQAESRPSYSWVRRGSPATGNLNKRSIYSPNASVLLTTTN